VDKTSPPARVPASLTQPATLAVAAAAAAAAVLVAAGGRGRAVEALLAGALAIAVRALPVRPLVPVAAAAVLYLALEGAFGRLGHERYWLHVTVLALLACVGAAAAAARRAEEAREAELAAAAAALDERGRRRELDEELAHGRAVEGLERELVRSRRHAREVSILLVRADGGTHDERRALAATIGRSIRATDVAAIGADGVFEVLLPETSAAGARVAAERIRLGSGDVSVSVGAASFPTDAGEVEELRAAARAALEHAAREGGNRTVLHTAPGEVPAGWALPRDSTST